MFSIPNAARYQSILFFTMMITGLISCTKPDVPSTVGLSIDELKNEARTLERTHTIGEDEDLILVSVSQIEFASDGTMLIQDPMAKKIHVYSADGAYLHAFGGEGDGPGEFQQPNRLNIWENDSVFIADRRLMRGSVFARKGNNWTIQRSFILPKLPVDFQNLQSVYKFSGMNGYVAEYSQSFSPGPEVERTDSFLIGFDENGEFADHKWITYSQPEYIITRSGRSVSVSVKPFHRMALLQTQPDRSYYLAPWTEHLHIVHFNADGDSIGGIHIPTQTRQVTTEDLAISYTHASDDILQNAAETHPAFLGFMISDRGNYFVRMAQIDKDNHLWVVFDKDGIQRDVFKLSSSAGILKIRDGKIYARFSDSGAEPHIRIYATAW